MVGVGPLRTRLQVAARRGLVRFVGRQRELAAVAAGPGSRPSGGQGQIVAVGGRARGGEIAPVLRIQAARPAWLPGAGDFFSVARQGVSRICRSSSCCKHYFQLTPQDDDRRRREQVTGKVLTLDRSLEDTLPYLLALLGDRRGDRRSWHRWTRRYGADAPLRRSRGCCCAKA